MNTLFEKGIASRSSSSGSSSEFDRQWRSFAVRRNLAAILVYGWPVFCATLLFPRRYLVHEVIAEVAFLTTWLIAAVMAVWWAGEFRCPRCCRRFAALGPKKTVNVTRGFFDSVCSNCKLAKFERAA